MSSDKTKLVVQRLTKGKETLSEVDVLVENKLWNTAVNRLYYACFYAVSALLVAYDFEPKTHSGTQHLFGLHFIKTGLISKELGKYYTDLMSMRQSADYEYALDYDEDDVSPLLHPAHNFIGLIEQYLREQGFL